MATTVDTLLVRIEADMSDLKNSLDKVQRDVEKSSQGIGAKFRQLGTVMKGALAAVVVQQAGRAGAAVIGLASDIEEMQGKSRVVFGEFRDQVVDDLEAFGDAVGRSTFELEGMASSIQDTFVPMGFARGEAAKLSVELTKLAVDVASFNNASDTETMEAFQSALVGNHETVRRFGVVITEATLNQELMRMGLAKGTKEATNAQKVQARLNLITRGTADAHGDAARTSGSFANQSRALKAELSELAGELGSILLPAVTDIVGALLSGARAAKQFMIDIGVLSKYTPDVAGMAAQISDLEQKLVDLKKAQAEQSFVGSLFKYYGTEIEMTERLIESRKKALQAKQDEIALDNREKALQQTPVLETPVVVDQTAADAAKELETKLKEQRAELGKNSSDLLINATNQRVLADAIRDGNTALEQETRAQIILKELKEKFPDLAKENIELLKHEANNRAIAAMNINAHTEALETSKEAQDNYAESVLNGIEHVKNAIDPNRQFKDTIKDIENALRSGKISTDEYKAAMAALELQMLEAHPVGNIFLNGFTQMADGVSNALADMAMGGKVTLRSFAEMFKGFVRQMLAQALKLLIVNAILRAMGVPLRYTGSGFEAGAGDAFGQKLAGGGTAQPNRPVLVGERGPEIFVPHSAGTVMNNQNTKQALGNGSPTIVNQTINVETGVSQTVKAEMISLLPRFRADAMRAVSDANMRGGSYRSSLA